MPVNLMFCTIFSLLLYFHQEQTKKKEMTDTKTPRGEVPIFVLFSFFFFFFANLADLCGFKPSVTFAKNMVTLI